jgi:Dyp-type peroxidase family
MPEPTLERDDIQGLLLHGYARHPYAAFLFLTIQDAAAARAWLRNIIPQIHAAVDVPPEQRKPPRLHVAFSQAGLHVLGLKDDVLTTFAQEFTQGMGTPDRARSLGDVDGAEPEKWEFGGPNGDAAIDKLHVLLMMYTASNEEIAPLVEQQRQLAAASGLRQAWLETSTDRPDNHEHFGFRDGISQPAIAGSGRPSKDGQEPIAAGEFILGYLNEYEIQPFSPQLPVSTTGTNLPPYPLTGRPDLGRNGSYVVFRKVEQDVAQFWRFMNEQTNTGHPDEDARRAEWLAAKCVGRWPSGTPLAIAPDADLPNLPPHPANDFKYHDVDAVGLRCPMGAHIRRVNPRDALEPGPAESLAMVRRHRVLRRGRLYGPPLENPRSGRDDGQKRGILFMALCANLARQFEFVQQTWMNNAKFAGLYDNLDPLLLGGVERAPDNTMTIPADPVRIRVPGLPRFTTLRGGGYFFLPGLRALQFLATG